MWLLYARAPLPELPYWPGRRFLAALDAALWPSICVALVLQMPARGGIVGSVVVAVAALAACDRGRIALWHNSRYRFTTWRWGRPLLLLLLFGWVMRWVLVR